SARPGSSNAGASRSRVRSSPAISPSSRSEEHTSELQSRENLVCRLLLEKKNLLLVFFLFVSVHSDTTVARMLVGNKRDLENIRAVSVDEGKALAEAQGLLLVEASALDSTHVRTAFEKVILDIYNNVSRKQLNSETYKDKLPVSRVCLVKDAATAEIYTLSLHDALPI